jgi:hypothetical protein
VEEVLSVEAVEALVSDDAWLLEVGLVDEVEPLSEPLALLVSRLERAWSVLEVLSDAPAVWLELAEPVLP